MPVKRDGVSRLSRRLDRWTGVASAWLRDRLADRPTGLLLTIGLLAAVCLTAAFFNIAKDVLLRDEIVDVDQYLIQLVYGWRSGWLTDVFRFMTFLGGIHGMALFMAALLLAAWRQRLLPLIFGSALALAILVTQSLKLLFGRLRPEEALRLVVENGFSFPSGHTFIATIIYGLCGYLLARMARRAAARWLIAAGTLLLIVAVGFSRVYLGVHFPSDVLASMSFASAFLCLFIMVLEINQRYRLRPAWLMTPAVRRPVLIALAAVALAGVPLSVII